MEKTCFKCSRRLPVTEFYRHRQMSDGTLGKCKECTKRDVRSRYYNKHSAVREYDRQRFKDPKRRAAAYAQAKLQRLKNPEKYKARNAVSNALRDGRLIRKPCEVCGDAKAQAHHPDYSRPLDVIWLCSFHHGEQHRKEALPANANAPAKTEAA